MESNDTLLTATQTGINAGEFGEFMFNGVIGDNPDTGDADDVDLYALELTESTRVVFDIDTNLVLTDSGVSQKSPYLRPFMDMLMDKLCNQFLW